MIRETTVCPLDCYDACRIIIDTNGKLKGDPSHPITRGYLCPNLNHYDEFPRLHTPMYRGKEISMDEAIETLISILSSNSPEQTLFYRGSGNLGVMQRSMDHFFSSFNAVGTSGSLCDGAGEAGILAGRGVNYPLSAEMIEQADTVIVWGKNPEVTHSHLLPILKKKKLVVIDPIRTALAQSAQMHLQIKPGCDLHLALILCRYLADSGMVDSSFIHEFTDGYERFSDLIHSIPVEETLRRIDITLQEIIELATMMHAHKCVILVGVGVQKYSNGSDVLRGIDAIGAMLGLFGKEGCGVSYLGSSLQGVKLPFRSMSNKVPIPTIDVSNYKTVFIQGANPLAQLPGTQTVRRGFGRVEEKIYFGTFENETSALCDLIIPAKSFLEKLDVRASYGDYTFQRMMIVRHSTQGIAEYDLAAVLCSRFGFSIPSEEESLSMLYDQIETKEGVEYKQNRPIIPYEKGFQTKSGKFEFLETADLGLKEKQGFFFITSKWSRSLNSQFNRPEGIYLHSGCGFALNEEVRVSSPEGSLRLKVIHDDRLRRDCALVYAGTKGVNILTPRKLSTHGENAVFQENKVKVEAC